MKGRDLMLWGGLAGFLAAVLGRRKQKPTSDFPGAPEDAEPDRPAPGETSRGYLRPIAVGDPKNPEIAALLIELNDFLRSEGVDPTLSALEITRLPKAPGRPVAIPDRSYWPNMAYTGRNVWNPIRREIGVALTVRGYRPPDYNAAVGGSTDSRHQTFSAIDVYAPRELRRKLALVAARLYLDEGSRLKMGFGAYGKPTPSNIHVDAGWKSARRPATWEDASYFVAEAKRIS